MKRFFIVLLIAIALGGSFAFLKRGPRPATPPAASSALMPVAPVAPPMASVADPAAAPMADAAIPQGAAGSPITTAFTLMDVRGNIVTEKSLPAKFKLVFFGFTNCPDICPAALQKLSAVMENYDPQGEKVLPIFISVDPARDTQRAIETYLLNYNRNIMGLTGAPGQIEQAQSNYKVFASKSGDTVNHSSYVYLLSPDNKVLEVLSDDLTAEDIIDKIKLHSD